MKRLLPLIALTLALCMLWGCSLSRNAEQLWDDLVKESAPEETAEQTLTYVRPDMEKHDRVLEEACQLAATETSASRVMDGVYAYYDQYDLLYAAYDISYLNYCKDITNTYWAEEYAYCESVVDDAGDGLDRLYYALADSPIRKQLESRAYFGKGYFDSYDGEYEEGDPVLTALFDRETELIGQYYELLEEGDSDTYYTDSWYDLYEPQLGELLVELVKVRQQLADYFYYDSYTELAYDLYHFRDYTPRQATTYLTDVGDELGSLYRRVCASDLWDQGEEACTQQETFRYVKRMAETMGADVYDAFTYLEKNKLYDIAPGANKYPASFEVYILYYYMPYIFLCPEETVYDKLSFTHEFGHFLADYVCGGCYGGTDIVEVHSQALEYLSLFYAPGGDELRTLKLADSLCTYVEQSAYSLFEHQLYALEGEELTLDNIRRIYRDICTEFGLDSWDWDARDYVTIPHFYEQPLYVVSYVVSNDLAMQIYQLEAEEAGAGLAVYEECIYSEDSYIGDFAEEYGLESPFQAGSMRSVLKLFEEVLP